MHLLSALRISYVPVTGFVAIGLFWGSFSAAVPQIKENIGASDEVFGWALMANALGVVSAMFLAPRIDALLGRRSLQISMAAFACILPFLIASWSVTSFVCIVVFSGFAAGQVDILINTRVSELESRHDQSLMNANHGMFSVAYAAAAIMMGVTRSNDWSLQWHFVIIALIVLAMVCWMAMDPDIEPTPEGAGGVWAHRMVILVCGSIVLIAFMTESTVEAWSALHIERTLHGNAAEGALGPAMLGITMALGRFSGQALSRRLSEIKILLISTALAAVGCVMAALAQTPTVAYVGFGIIGLGVAVIGPIGLGMVGRFVPKHLRSRAISAAAVIGFSAFFVAPGIMGMISQAFDLRVAYLTVTGLVLILLPLIWATRRWQQ